MMEDTIAITPMSGSIVVTLSGVFKDTSKFGAKEQLRFEFSDGYKFWVTLGSGKSVRSAIASGLLVVSDRPDIAKVVKSGTFCITLQDGKVKSVAKVG